MKTVNITPHSCESILEREKKATKQMLNARQFKNAKFLIINPPTADEELAIANSKYVNSKVKHLRDAGFDVIVYNAEVENDYILKNICSEHRIPALIQKTENFQKHCEKLMSIVGIDNIEFDFGTTPTAMGAVMTLEDIAGADVGSGNVLLIGRSDLVGKPLLKMLLKKNYTITIANSHTKPEDLLNLFWQSDVVFTATGNKDVLDFSKQKILPTVKWRDKKIIDLGINKVNGLGGIIGDFNPDKFKEFVEQHCEDGSYNVIFTPTPKGTGLSTVAALLIKLREYYL